MSGTTEELRRRIEGAENLEGVVRSMKAIAASSISQYERAVTSLQDYARTIELGLGVCLREAGVPEQRVNPPRAQSIKVGVIVFGSDQGLVGRFNEVIVDFAVQSLGPGPRLISAAWGVGQRAGALLDEARKEKSVGIETPSSVEAITTLVGKLLVEVETALERRTITDVHVFHNHPVSAARYEPVGIRLLPLDRIWRQKAAQSPWPTHCPPEVLEGSRPALQAFLRGYLFVMLFQACAESLASENACRLAAMQRAEKNIGDILADLNRGYHRIRQESIDEELFDVIAGYEALA